MSLDSATDSCEYSILTNAVVLVSQLSGLTLEIGVRQGGSSYKIMNAIKQNGIVRPHIGIDPYGNIDYADWETRVIKADYTNMMLNQAMANLYKWCYENNYPFIFLPLEDTEFFKRYADGIPIYNEHKSIINEYALVFFDGPHTTAIVLNEIEFFASRTQLGGVWVFDDINQYRHLEKVHPIILNYGFEVYEKGSVKMSYKRVR